MKDVSCTFGNGKLSELCVMPTEWCERKTGTPRPAVLVTKFEPEPHFWQHDTAHSPHAPNSHSARYPGSCLNARSATRAYSSREARTLTEPVGSVALSATQAMRWIGWSVPPSQPSRSTTQRRKCRETQSTGRRYAPTVSGSPCCMCGRPLGCKRKNEKSDGGSICDHVSGLT
jgi:hypothetical protein